MSDDQIKIHTLETSSDEPYVPRENKHGKITHISVIEEKHKKIKKVIKKPKTKTISDILFIVLKFLHNIPKFFASFLNAGGKSIYYGIIGTMVSFIFALLLFPENPGIFAVFFATLFIAPFIINETNLNSLLVGRTRRVEKNGVTLVNFRIKDNEKFSLEDFYEENKKLLSIHFFFFIGVMLVVTSLIAFIPAEYSASLFNNQGWSETLLPSREIGFEGVNKWPVFKDILINNASVTIVCFIVSLVFPLGAALLIVWNAMYWAVSFSQYSLFYSAAYGTGLVYILLPLFLSVGLHTLIEAIAYFFSTMSGSLLATGLRKEKIDSDRFFYIFKYCITLFIFAVIFLIIGSIAEVFLFDFLKNIFFSLF